MQYGSACPGPTLHVTISWLRDRRCRAAERCSVTASVVIGGSSGIGRHIAERMVARGDEVIISSRDATRAKAVAAEVGAARGLALDLSAPKTIADGLADVGPVSHLVITAIEQGVNSVAAFDIDAAVRSVTVKLVGYTETIRVLHPRLEPGASIVLFGGLAKDRPYPGSTVVTAFNGGVSTLVATLAVELAPTRVNALHPGVVGDSPKWRDVADHPHLSRTPIGRLVTMDEVADATDFLLRNTGINAQNLYIDGGLLAT